MSKLTLSVDVEVIARAKLFAEKRGISVSRLVEQFLDLVAQPLDLDEHTPCSAEAQTSGCDAIVTRDPKGFPNSPVPVIVPETAVAWLMSE